VSVALLRRPHEHLAADPHLIHLRSEEEVDALAERILGPQRAEPLVCLTSRSSENYPALDPAEIRAIVGPEVQVFFLRTGRLSFALQDALPQGMSVFGGAARIWWPGVSDETPLFDHPLIHEASAVYGSQAVRAFESAWGRGAPATGSEEDVDPILALPQQERDDARAEVEELRHANGELSRRVQHERDLRRTAQRRARDLRGRLTEPAPEEHTHDVDPELAFHQDLLETWFEHLTPSDRRERPLGSYLVGAQFLSSVAQLQTVSRDRVAWVCAMVAGGRGPELANLELHPLRSGRGGNDPPRVRARDGATAWRCALKTNSPSAPRLHYWLLADGTTEFAKVGPHDDMDISES